jgi:plastocyanin
VRRVLRFAVLACALGLIAPAGALAQVQTLVFTSSPIRIDPFGVARGAQQAASPRVDGSVVAMSADIVDGAGNVVPNPSVMLHHVVFVKVLHRDFTCSTFTDYDGQVLPFPVERFYGEGEEHARLALPDGYGYPNGGSDVWALVYMLMNHHSHQETVFVRYTVSYAVGEQRTPVTPVWLDVHNCTADPIFNVPGTGGPRSTFSRQASFTMPVSGHIVAAAGHLHGGGVRLELASSRCGEVFRSVPTEWMEEPRPAMHEPGPSAMSGFVDAAGIPVQAGDTLTLRAVYGNAWPHMRVMGISIGYFAEGPAAGCARFGADTRPMPAGPRVVLPLLKEPAGRVTRDVRATWVGDFRFGAQRVSIRRGTTFTWRFVGAFAHDVTLATGPVALASPDLRTGSWSYRFRRPGTYRFYCSLHPSLMTQIIVVR